MSNATCLSFLRVLLSDPCAALTLAALVFAIGSCAVGRDERVRRAGAALGGVVFLATVWVGVSREGEVLSLAVSSVAWAGLTVGTAWIVLAVIAGLVQWVVASVRESRHKQEQLAEDQRRATEERERREAEHRHAAELARIAAERHHSQAPPPTKQDLLAQAKARYETTLRMLETAGLDEAERAAARLRAKQQYLRELDETLR